ncbi:hypothetical protein ACFFLM_12870 [Deinococcus oregonensis]|uniref:Uncharacterized protein n=1 Tax=Deinococcus oregonensis TaxID=1805970 RepID=A0ABV6AZB8_9DEIO
MTGPKKGSRGRAPKRNVAQGRGGATRENTTPVRERTTARGSEISSAGSGKSAGTGRAGSARAGATRSGAKSSSTRGSSSQGGSSKTGPAREGGKSRPSQPESRSGSGRPDSAKPASAGSTSTRTDIVKVGPAKSGSKARAGAAKSGARPSKLGSTKTGTKSGWVRPTGTKPGGIRGGTASRDPDAGGEERSDDRAPAGRSAGQRSEGGRSFSQGGFTKTAGRSPAPRINGKKALPELKRVQLDAPDPTKTFKDRDGELLTFPDSNLKRVAAQILTEKNKAWRYRPFAFPLFTERGGEQSFYFDFYVYDAEDSVIRLLLVVPFESREVWDKVGRFKRQYPMYTYELWTPEKLARLMGPRGNLGF